MKKIPKWLDQLCGLVALAAFVALIVLAHMVRS